jgi:hypothetical protein
MSQASNNIAAANASRKTGKASADNAAPVRRQVATQAERTIVTFETAVRVCPCAGQVAAIIRAFGLPDVDYAALRDATEEQIARSATGLTDILSEKALEMHLQRIVDAFVRSAHGAGSFFQGKADIARDLSSKAANEERDEDRPGTDGTANRAERAREFAGQMAVQAYALLAAADGAVQAYVQVTGNEWKPYAGAVRAHRTVERQAAAAQLEALGMCSLSASFSCYAVARAHHRPYENDRRFILIGKNMFSWKTIPLMLAAFALSAANIAGHAYAAEPDTSSLSTKWDLQKQPLESLLNQGWAIINTSGDEGQILTLNKNNKWIRCLLAEQNPGSVRIDFIENLGSRCHTLN